MTKKESNIIKIPTAYVDMEQYNPAIQDDWGTYIPIKDEMMLLELNMKFGNTPYLLEGDKGTGKTLMVHTVCRQLGIPLVEFSCSMNTTRNDLLGRIQINESGSFFELGVLPIAYEVANHYKTCCLYLDELNSTQHEVMKLFNRPFDKRRSVIANGKTYKLNQGCRLIIVGTMNPVTYAGVNSLTEDLRSRMIGDIIEYPKESDLERITNWTDIPDDTKKELLTLATEIHALRMKGDVDYVLSPRDIDQFCYYYRLLSNHLSDISSLKNTLKQVIVTKFSEIEERELIKTRIHEIFGVTV